MLDRQEVAQAMPKHLQRAVTDELIDKINAIAQDSNEAEVIRDNLIGYTQVLKEGKFSTEEYANAVSYVSFKLMECTNQEAWARTFPDRYDALMRRGATDKTVSSYVAAYNKSKLVNLILEQTLIPTWVLNADIYQSAINEQAKLMTTAKSEMVRTQAANSILTHLKRPEKQQVDLNISAKDNSGMKELQTMLTDLAEQQQEAIRGGMRTTEVAHQKLRPLGDEEIPDAEIVEDSENTPEEEETEQ